MGRKQLTKIEKEEIVNLYKTGISASKIAKSYNTSVDTVSKWVKRAGIEVVNKQNIIKVSDYFAIKDYKNGMSLTQISKKYGIGRHNLSKRKSVSRNVVGFGPFKTSAGCRSDYRTSERLCSRRDKRRRNARTDTWIGCETLCFGVWMGRIWGIAPGKRQYSGGIAGSKLG